MSLYNDVCDRLMFGIEWCLGWNDVWDRECNRDTHII